MKKKKNIVIILFIFVIVLICSIVIYNVFFKYETVNLELEADVYSDKTLFDYKDDIACNLTENQEIDTAKVGNTQIITKCKNDEKDRFKYIINFNIVDKVEPKIILKDSYTVTEGYDKKLTDVIISFDNWRI